jgi:hypothetical protein
MKSKSPTLSTLLAEKEKIQGEELDLILNGSKPDPDQEA